MPAATAGWALDHSRHVDGPTATERFDRLVVANGVFCEPCDPDVPGRWRSSPPPAGGCCAATEVHDAEQARDKHVVVVGYGKSACDVAVPMSEDRRVAPTSSRGSCCGRCRARSAG